jgi:glycosyltransferase involved in cell wall biosynthesis
MVTPLPRLRVAVDALPLIGRPTGVGAFCQGALAALATRTDLDVRAFAVSWRGRDDMFARLPATVTSRQRPMPARPLHRVWSRVDFPPVEWFIGPVDVVHGTNFTVPPARKAAAVISVHDLTPVFYPELCDAATLAYPGLIRRAIGRGAWVHADSSFVAAEVVETFGADPARVRVVTPGIPPLPSVDEATARRSVDPLLPAGTNRYVLAVSTAEPRKDLPGLVRAFDQVAAELPDVALVLAGPPGWGDAALIEAIGAMRAAARVIRTGWVEDDMLAALLRQAAVLAYPSLYEGFGFPPLQAMQHGVPVVATRAGSVPEVVGEAAALVAPKDTDGLADAVSRILGQPGYRQQLIAAGRAQAALYSWERCGAELEQLYRAAAAATR